MARSVKDYYAILGVSPQASLDEIRVAYRRRARAAHPDLSTDPHAEEHFKEINEAYDVLANPEKRRAYDSFITDEPAPCPPQQEREPAPATVVSREPTAPPEAVAPPPPPPERQAQPEERRSRRLYPPTWAILLIMLGACILIGVGAGAVISLQGPQATGGASSVRIDKLSTFLSPPIIPDDQTVLQEGGTPLLTIAPQTLNIAGSIYPVVAVTPEQGRWPLPEADMGVALWVHGTLINYVVGIPYTEMAEARLAGLSASARITLTLENGTQLAFGSPQSRRIDSNDLAPLAQDKPGLTLMLVGSPQTNRLVVQARYLPEGTQTVTGQRAAGLLVEVLDSYTVQEEAEMAWLVVDYQVTNENATAVDSTYFDMVLEDNTGQRYTLSEEVTTQGNYGQLIQPIAGGATAQGSAGYIIPQDVTTPLVWIFRADPTATSATRHALSYKPPPPQPAEPYVALDEVFLDEQRDVIVVMGYIANDGELALNVEANDVSLTSAAGETPLQVASPPMPWTLEGGADLEFELQFTAPQGVDTANLNIVGFSFQIEGL